MSVQNKYRNLSVEHNSLFRQKLSQWHDDHARFYPWVGEKNPYKVWLSEIILQQTRVEQGLPYYERFLQHFPTVIELASADEQLIFRLWQGLGYYNRCKNMIKTAKIICNDYQGVFPKDYEKIIKLPGIGPYTAAAISSFAFNLPHAVVDGNVERFLSRYFGIDEPVNSTGGKEVFTQLATELLNEKEPASFNQAIMDFGATICAPRNPLCEECPFSSQCIALKENRITQLPVKKKKPQIKKRYLNYYLLHHKGYIYIRKRQEGDIWQNLHEFLLYESHHQLSEEAMLQAGKFIKVVHKNKAFSNNSMSSTIHQLTHQKLYIQFLEINLSETPELPSDFFAINIEDSDFFAFPRPMVKYLNKIGC